MSIGAKAALLEEYALIARALSAPARLTLLEHLAQGERGVDALSDKTGLSIANCSQHLQQLRRAGLVTSRREGKAVVYRMTDTRTLTLMDLLRRVAVSNLNRVDSILRSLSEGQDMPEPLSREDLALRMAEGAVTVLDIRPRDEFDMGHIPSARQVTLADLDRIIPDLEPAAEVVAYCRGPYCIYAHQAVAALRRKGLNARQMEGGLPEWRAEGRPVLSDPKGRV